MVQKGKGGTRMIKIRIHWEHESEIDLALEIKSKIHDLLETTYFHTENVNDPVKSFGIDLGGEK